MATKTEYVFDPYFRELKVKGLLKRIVENPGICPENRQLILEYKSYITPGKKVFIQGVPEGEYPISFKHCGHEITIVEDKKPKKIRK